MVKWLTQRIVAPPRAGSIPVVRPIKRTQSLGTIPRLFVIFKRKTLDMTKIIGKVDFKFYIDKKDSLVATLVSQ